MDYIEFLLEKYAAGNNLELSAYGMSLINESIRKSEEDPESTKTWEEIKQELRDERGYDI